MSLKEALGNLTQNTKRFASVAFADYEYSPEVSRLLSKQPKLIREANESESMLYNYYNGHENIKSIMSRLPNLKGETDIRKIQRALQILSEINDICKDQATQHKIDSLSREIEQRNERIVSLDAKYTEKDAELDAINERIEINKLEYITEEAETTTTTTTTTAGEQGVYRNLKQQLKALDERRASNQRRKRELEGEMKQERDWLNSRMELETLEKQIAQIQHNIDDISHGPKLSSSFSPSTRDIFIGLEAQLDKMSMEEEGSQSAEKQELMNLLGELGESLKDTIKGMTMAENKKNSVQMFKDLYVQLLSLREKEEYHVLKKEEFEKHFALSDLNKEEFQKHFALKDLENVFKEGSILQAVVLSRLLDTKQLPLSELAQHMDEYSKQHNLSEKEASQAGIYKLSREGLLEIIRTEEDTIVKMTE